MKRIKINYILVGAVTLLLALALWPNITWHGGQRGQLAAIKSRGELRISTLNSPLTYFTTKQGAGGLDYELAIHFANYLGVKLVVISQQNINDMFNDLDEDNADLLAASLNYNPERLASARIGPTYYSVSQQLVYRLGSPRPKSFADIKGKLAVASGSAHISTLKQLKRDKFPDLKWQTASDLTSKELLEQVDDGKLDYTLGDSVTIALLQRVHPQLAVAFDVTDEQPITWYLKRGNDDSLYAAMLDFFNQIVDDNTLARLEEKYLGHVGSFDYVDTKTFLSAIDVILPNFRSLFEKYAKEIDWKLLAAIAYQESHWDPQATSPTGVRGLMMLTRATADSLGVNDRLDPQESIQGGALYLQRLMAKVPDSVPVDERIWFSLAAYNMGWGHMLDARKLTKMQQGNPDSWLDVKQRLPMLSQKRYHSQLTYGYARGREAYNYVENIRRYQVSLVGYLQEKEKKAAQEAANQEAMGRAYPAISPELVIDY
ncbi:putative predicted periplasmic binding protein/transglycosylase [Serratia symbiotica str. Tucson]|uniref:Membrane-bound lytic murein transglycosylase F n=2 Tax=Serratia symbiotica TaxID=138074 RepID=E9CL75_9GAMM|nr:membrane-bound lytic murein transglycosylase MltF [Serratia symbiotica]EFW12652.1 putative predicted periplasmic binding protein/transglycosylase [Serratia symbiotica str. Tucson]BBI92520.1 membrane-bound lytic murein transglycosylase F [Serratia symbiotica]